MDDTHPVIDRYYPNLSADVWTQLRPFVCATVQQYAAGRADLDIERALTVLATLGDWALFTGLSAPGPDLLRSDVIDAFCAQRKTEVSTAVAERERKQLRTLGGLENAREARESSTTAPPSTPYTVDEQNDIRHWTSVQPSEGGRRTCALIAALGLGAGLTAAEMMHARHRDVLTLPDGLPAIQVGQRQVPLAEAWAREVAANLVGAPDDYLLAPSATCRRSAVLSRITVSSRSITPSVQRMRVTWLLAHLDAGTPLLNLMDAAGLEDPSFLRRLLPFASRLNGAAHVRALRLGAEVTR
jgi:hypothetical protein